MRLLHVLYLVIVSGSANAQFQCPPGSWPESPGGNVIQCRCPDNQLANYDGCPSSLLNTPQPVQETNRTPSPAILNNPVVKAFEELGELLMSGEKNVSTWGSLSNQLSSSAPPPPPNHAAQVALDEMLHPSSAATSQTSSQTTSSFKLPDYPAQTPAPAPSSPKSTCSDYRDPNCFVTLKPPSESE